MEMKHIKIFIGLALLLCLAASSPGLIGQQGRPEPTKDFIEFRTAARIQDPALRLKELEHVLATYPSSSYKKQIEKAIIGAKVEMSVNLTEILALQKQALDQAQGAERLETLYSAAMDLIEHPALARFEAKVASAAVLDYAAQGLKLAADEEFLKSLPQEVKPYLSMFAQYFLQTRAQAYLLTKEADPALRALDEYKAKGGDQDAVYAYLMATAKALQGQDKDALDYYFQAAVGNYLDSRDKAIKYYKKINGSTEGFEAKLEARQRELPFHPQPFQVGPEWKGKAVLVELFTGSECPPCVAADLAVDGLLETFSPKYLAVLEYHLPIPRPDPLMNHATALRAKHYGVRSTPSLFFDGQPLTGGGGPTSLAKAKYQLYLEEIRRRINADPGLKLGLTATRLGDDVQVAYTLDKILDNAGYHIALVQKEEKFGGGNGIIFHKMVVREFKTLEDVPGLTGRLTINLPASEQAAQERIAAYERQMSFKFKEKHTAIDRGQLRVVFFTQDKSSGKVYAAAVADVK